MLYLQPAAADRFAGGGGGGPAMGAPPAGPLPVAAAPRQSPAAASPHLAAGGRQQVVWAAAPQDRGPLPTPPRTAVAAAAVADLPVVNDEFSDAIDEEAASGQTG